MRVLLACCLWLSAFAPAAHAAQVERIEPANWWIGMRHDRVELLVHGKGIAATTPRLSHAGVAIVAAPILYKAMLPALRHVLNKSELK